jgi:hypothetical protein
MRRSGLVLLIFALGFLRAVSANAVANPSDNGEIMPMQVIVARDSQAGCEPSCARWISAEGDIIESTYDQFQRVLNSTSGQKLSVLVNSGGGNVDTALKIGRLLRSEGVDVVVSRTDFVPCSRSSGPCEAGSLARGRPNVADAYCVSACVFLLAGGRERLVSPWAQVGAHQLRIVESNYVVRRVYSITTISRPGQPTRIQRTLIRETRTATGTSAREADGTYYAKVEDFLKAMGLGADLAHVIRETPSGSIRWLSQSELKSFGLATQMDGPNALIALADPPPPMLKASDDGDLELDPRIVAYASGLELDVPLRLTYRARGRSLQVGFGPLEGGQFAGGQVSVKIDLGPLADLLIAGTAPARGAQWLIRTFPAESLCKALPDDKFEISIELDRNAYHLTATRSMPLRKIGLDTLIERACSRQAASPLSAAQLGMQ